MRIFDIYLILIETQQVKISNVNGVSIYTGIAPKIPETLFRMKIKEMYSDEKNIIYLII